MTRVRFSIVAVAVLSACGGEKSTEPNPPVTHPASLRLIFPDTVTRGVAFPLSVTALDVQGQTNTSWSGSVTLAASSGVITPTTVNIVNGSLTVQATIRDHAGSVNVTSSVGSASGSRAAFVFSEQAAARLEVHPQTFLLSAPGSSQTLQVRAFDADGFPTSGSGVTWQSSKPGMVAVSASGTATAVGAGSSTITASTGTITSDPALAVVTTPAAGVLLVPDSLIVSGFTPVNPQAPYGPGWQFRVRLSGAAPQVGQLLAARGEKPLAGRVTAVQSTGAGHDVTVELVPLEQILPDLSIDETIPLNHGTEVSSLRKRAPWEASFQFQPGAFDCEATLTQPNSNPLTMASITAEVTPLLQAHIVHNAVRKRLHVQGGLTASATVRPTLTVGLTGSIECKLQLRDIPIPVGGALSAFLGARVLAGVGITFELGGTVATMGLDVQMSGGATLSFGYDCVLGTCSVPFNLGGSATGSVIPNLPSLASDFRFTAAANPFAWADLQIGPQDYFPGAADLRRTFLESKVGVKQEFNLASENVQAADAAYASSFSLTPFASGGTKPDLQLLINEALSLIGVSIPTLTFETTGDALAKSPAGSFQIIPSRVGGASPTQPGDTATFIVDLSRTNYLIWYAVDTVRIFRKPSATGALVPAPGPCASIAPTSAAQSLFTCKTDLPSSMAGTQTFYAFVKPKLPVALPVLLEVAPDSRSTLTVDHVAYFRDFTTGPAGPEWSSAPLKTSPSGQRFLGELGNSSTTLSLDSLPTHTQLVLEFDLYIIDSWNGNGGGGGTADIIEISVVGGPVLKRTTFSNRTRDAQAYPGDYPGGVYAAGTGRTTDDTLGYPASNDGYGDTSYRLRLAFNHTAGAVALRFASQQSSGQNEKWGIDNVRVTIVP
jgi:hypothetical protein